MGYIVSQEIVIYKGHKCRISETRLVIRLSLSCYLLSIQSICQSSDSILYLQYVHQCLCSCTHACSCRLSFPKAYIIKNSIGKTATTIICAATLFAFAIQAIAQLQASSRFIWAIARDQALPFSKYLYQTDKNRLPTAATWLVLLLSAPICFLLWPFPDISLSVLSVAAGTFCLISYVS